MDTTIFLTSLNELAEKARKISLGYFRQQNFSTVLKEDQSPVTEADLEIEKLIRDYIKQKFPTHGIIGEEFENHNPEAEYQWTIDPIDGTQNFISGIPTFETMIAVLHKGVPIAGLMDHPAIDFKVIAAKGCGCFLNGEPVSVDDSKLDSKSPLIKSSIIACSTPQYFKLTGESQLFEKLCNLHDNLRMYYDFFGDTMAAIGRIDAAFCMGAKPYEIPTIQIIAEEAGAKFFYFKKIQSKEGMTLSVSLCGKPKVVNYLIDQLQIKII